ncbi:MAG: TIGR04282 family arsenosugar biosynthesis glycosyltransferase [Acidobacteriota bacterium]|nr:TIGR04282 family arsenosugar biosynthesis glycosyltransferase [Acidobacteriota bacterium]MDQ7088087.1 TIGR04282 family arsenosugar biosynthesis glycosyltransferase [Acidobacteriota bacterium]
MNEVLAVFCRWPEPGKVKTRLIPALGAEGAAAFQRRCIERVVELCRGLRRPGLVTQLWITPDSAVAEVPGDLAGDFTVHPQGEGDLGARMARAVVRARARGARRVVVIGTDCPALDRAVIDAALDGLRRFDAVINEAEDGGYCLIGLARAIPSVFQDIAWGTEAVAAQTLERLEAAGAATLRLPPLGDVDRPEDLHEVRRRWPRLLDGV